MIWISRKNLESKIHLCEKAEELLLEPNVVEAFRILQDLHDQWREIGPVPAEMRVEIWNRFKEATSKINKKHQEHFVDLKNEQKNKSGCQKCSLRKSRRTVQHGNQFK